MRLRALALAVVSASVLAAGCGDDGGESSQARGARRSPSVETRPTFVGVASEDAFADPGRYRRATFKTQHRAGIRLIRQTFDWSKFERTPGRYDFAYHDRYVADAARAGLTIMPILFRPPAFRQQAASPEATSTTTAPPKDLKAMARWVRALVKRYGSDGALWKRNPHLEKHPIRDWQVWNEPNLPAYWNAHPSPREYVRMLRVVGEAIRTADPQARVVSAGLTESRLGMPFAEYLRQLYSNGVAGTFDVLAVNAYSKTARGVVTAVTQARRITAAAEDGDKPIWLTEFGWATPPSPRGSFTVTDRRQSDLVANALVLLDGQRERLNLRGVVYYQWRDAPVYDGGRDYWGLHTGLLKIDGAPKPSLRAFARVARSIARADED